VIEAICAGGGGDGGAHESKRRGGDTRRRRRRTRRRTKDDRGGGADVRDIGDGDVGEDGVDNNMPRKDDDGGNRGMVLAEELLRSMGECTGIGITSHAREIVISGYARRGYWMDAMRTLMEMEVDIDEYERDRDLVGGGNDENVGWVGNDDVYLTVLTSLARANRYDVVNTLLTSMRRRGCRPDVYVYNSLLKLCASDATPRWREALSLLSQCQREPGIKPDLITYTTAMRACARGRKAGKAMELFRAVRDMGTLTLDVYFYTTAMDACAKEGGRRWMVEALSLLDEMGTRGIVPNEVTYGVAVAACGNAGRWEEALVLLDKMRDAGLRINTITYNSAIAALSRAARSESRHHHHHHHQQQQQQQQQQRALSSSSSSDGDSSSAAAENAVADADADVLWEKATRIMKCMEDEGVHRDSFTYSSAIGVCGAAGRWREAVDLIREMKGNGARPNRVAFTSAITACAISRQWESAFEIFKEMKYDGLQPDIVAYNALIGAGMNSNKPKEVYDIWGEMCNMSSSERVSPDIVTLTEVVATLDKAPGRVNRERVDEVFSEAVKRGLILRKDSLDTSLEVDLSSMSFPIARAACRFIFRRIAERSSEDGEIGDLSLITGPPRMREYVREVLRDELTPPVYCMVPKAEQGTLLVKKQVLTNYIRGQ
ncbi:hypothetical protein ACHAXA_005340, partial [Cyclostephanos tholiformis]